MYKVWFSEVSEQEPLPLKLGSFELEFYSMDKVHKLSKRGASSGGRIGTATVLERRSYPLISSRWRLSVRQTENEN